MDTNKHEWKNQKNRRVSARSKDLVEPLIVWPLMKQGWFLFVFVRVYSWLNKFVPVSL